MRVLASGVHKNERGKRGLESMRCQCQDPQCFEHSEKYVCLSEATHALLDAEGNTFSEVCEACGKTAVETLEYVTIQEI